ncbi:MAG: sugar phosphate isomerase, partial [Kiritimatiellae bacterium]|nr:sugar phosphate isomerase [Kiritimatiellia bacterium]
MDGTDESSTDTSGYIMSNDYRNKAAAFAAGEKAFRLGFLPTEQSNPLTRGLDRIMAADTPAGVRILQRVDREVLAMARKVLAGTGFKALIEAGTAAIVNGHKIIFSGCGATGRLSILLEAMWRRFLIDLQTRQPETRPWASELENAVESIMTGGDYALIRAVEFFEDYAEFGRQQVREAQMTAGDILVAITEGGETSSVLGTVSEAARRGARVFLLFNNPAELLRTHLERSREAIENPAVTVLDLHCGPMAIAGSTRMQATTSEQLIAGAALELILGNVLQARERQAAPAGYRRPADYAADFAALLNELEAEAAVKALAGYIDFETDIYFHNGLVTYLADDYLLDIFTDTTERSPTFMLPPFRKRGDEISPCSWAFVKHPSLATPEAWQHCLSRPPRCLNWTAGDYRRLGAGAAIA